MNAVKSLLSNAGENLDICNLEAFSQIGENSDKVLFFISGKHVVSLLSSAKYVLSFTS
jgi:hypothetical protein